MTPCPSHELLQRLLADQLSDAEERAAGAHVEACPHCQQILETLTAFEATAPPVASLPGPEAAPRPSPGSTASRSANRADGEALGETELWQLRQLLCATTLDAGGLAPAVPVQADWPIVPSYEILGELGRGGMGIVYRARHLRLNRLVALKLVRAESAVTPMQRPRFLVEGEVLARLQHPNVVQIYDIGFYQGQAYLALELVEGGSLAAKLNGKPLPVREAAELLACLAQAVHAAHAQRIIHRDLKPANVLLRADGVPKLTDFGLAKTLDVDLKLTRTGDVLGTPAYMAPEQALGQAAQIGPLTDVYALGVILYETLTGRPPFLAATYQEVLQQVSWHEPVPPRHLQPQVPRDLETICLRCLQKAPHKRYASAGELADDVRRFLAGEPIRARPVGRTERLWRWCRRNPTVASLAAAVVLALAVGTTVSSLKYLDAEQQKGIALQQQARAETGEKEAKEQRNRADHEAEIARQNLYCAQMHLAPQAWREHRGLAHLDELLANWLPEGNSPDRRGWEWFYLNSLPYQNLRTIVESGGGNRQKVLGTAVTPCTVAWHIASKRLAEGTADGVIRIWDVDREQTTLILRGPAPEVPFWGVRWLAWSPDGSKLAAGCRDGTVRVWETGTGRQLHVLRGHKSPVWSVAVSSDGTRVAAWGWDGTIKLWDADTGRLTAGVHHPGDVFAGAWSPNDKLLASGHGNGTVTISGAHAGDKIITLRGQVGSISNLAWSPDGTRLASTSRNDSSVRIWDIASAKMVLDPLRHSHEITSLAWEPDGQRLATGSADETVKIWNATTGREAYTLRGHRERITSLAWGPDGRLASGSGDGSLRIWNSIRDQEASVLPGHGVRATSVSWSPSGKRLASGGDDGKLRIWNPATGKEVLILKGHNEGRVDQQFGLIRSLAWSPDGTQLASAGLDGTAKVWEVASGRIVFALPADRGPVWSVAWSPDGTHLAAGSQDGTVRVVEALKHTPKVHVFQAHQGRVRSLAWSPQGDRLASGGEDRLVKLWDPIRGTELTRMAGHHYWVMGVAWSPDGKRLASASGDRLVIAWDTETGRRLSTMRGHNDFVDAVVWSPDGKRLASAGLDDSVRIWDSRTGEEAFVLRGNSGMFHDVSWSPDGAQLAAASSDDQIWVWNATRGFERDTTARALPFIDRKVASGTARGEDRLAFAQIAYDQRKFAFAARLWAEALASDPKLFDDRQMQHRYNAARAAALAAAGQGEDEPPLDDAAKAKLRHQALDWLRAERAAWAKILESGSPQAGPALVQKLNDWKQDSDLAGIRDAAALAKLPADEQQAFAQFWADVGAMDTTLLLLQSGAPPLLQTAALQAWFGRDQELAATRDRVLRVSKDTQDPTTAERTAKICSLRQSDDGTHDAALVLARRAVELGEGHDYQVYFQMELGMAEYRSGHYAEADAALRTAARLGNTNYHISVTTGYYRAMSLFRQGKVTEARKLAAEAAAKMRPLPADEKNPLEGEANADDLILWMAYKEAKALIKFDAAPPAKVANDNK